MIMIIVMGVGLNNGSCMPWLRDYMRDMAPGNQ